MAALPQAGVELVAKNFDQYIRQLKEIDKLQQQVFNTKYTGVESNLNQAGNAAKNYENKIRSGTKSTKDFGSVIAGAAGGGVVLLTNALIKLADTAVSSLGRIVSSGVMLNREFQQSSIVLGNVFGDLELGKAAVEEIVKAADQFRIDRGGATAFAQNILPRTGSLETFIELLRLTDIQSDTTGKSVSELEFSIREALSGDFVSLKDQFDIGNDVVNRIKELTPVLGADAALAQVLGEEFARLGKVNLEGTLTTQVKDLQSQFNQFAQIVGEPVFAELQEQLSGILAAIENQGPGVERLAVSFGEVVANVVEFVGTNLADFINNINFDEVNRGVDVVFAITEAFKSLFNIFRELQTTGVTDLLGGVISGDLLQIQRGLAQIKETDFDQFLSSVDTEIQRATSSFNDYTQRVEERLNAEKGATDAQKESINAILSSNNAVKQASVNLDAYNSVVQRAEDLQLSFARAAEDAARNLGRQQSKLADSQAKELDKLFQDQQSKLDDFNADRVDKIAKVEKDIAKAQDDANKRQIKQQQDTQRKLLQDIEKFNLSKIQSERRFSLDERRLRAEGDILGLQNLREDFALQQQENQENFNLDQRQNKQNTQDSIRQEQEKTQERQAELQQRLDDLKVSLEEERAELLTSFDTQEQELRAKQLEQRNQLLQSYAEQQEDARINQQRQLEDLGRSLARQKDITSEGVLAVSGEIEKIFGQEGVADTIFGGFTTRTESEFTDLFTNITDIVTKAQEKIQTTSQSFIPPLLRNTQNPNLPIRLPGFDDGGIVPGRRGSPQAILAHGGETVLPTHKITAPVIPAQRVDVAMSGGFNITGGEIAGREATQAAIKDMVEMFEIAINRVSARA